MHRYNICNRLTTGDLLYLGYHQQWVSNVMDAVTFYRASGEEHQSTNNVSILDVSGVFLVPVRETPKHAAKVVTVVPGAGQQTALRDVSLIRRA